MLPSAVAKARYHWQRAAGHLTSIGPIFEGDITPIWSNFLSAANSVYEALKKGKKGSQQSEVWFAQKRRERRVDELLNYLHHARNASEHGLYAVLEKGPEPRGEDVFKGCGEKWDSEWTDEGYVALLTEPDGTTRRAQFTPPDYRLIRVYDDRSDTWFAPPTEHLGKPLQSTTPLAVGKLWLDYLARMIDEAEALPSPPPP
jgi:hypothetical protein